LAETWRTRFVNFSYDAAPPFNTASKEVAGTLIAFI
jgi:hypothetical protein